MRELRLTILADYHQVLVADATADWSSLSEAWTPDAIRKMVAIGPDYLGFVTARNTIVPVKVRILDLPPAGGVGIWDKVNEAELELPSGILTVSGVSDRAASVHRVEVPPGRYCIRISYGGLDSLTPDGLGGDDRYLVELWPDRPT